MTRKEDTAAGDPALAETVARDPLAMAAIAADAEAWSDAVEIEAPRRRRFVWAGLVALVCAMAAVLAAVAITMTLHPARQAAPAPAAKTTPPAPTTATPETGPIALDIHNGADEDFMNQYLTDHLPYRTLKGTDGYNRLSAMLTGRTVCDNITHGMTVEAEIQATYEQFGKQDGWTLDQLRTLVADARRIYCPEVK